MVLTTTNLYSETRTIVKNLINSNVTDPKIGSTSSRRRWIYREFPDTTSRDFKGFPIIVLKSPDINDEVLTLNQTFRDNLFTFEIEVYAEFNDANARVDSISDQVANAILSNQDSLASSGLFNANFESSPFVSATEDGKQLSARLFRIEFSHEICWGSVTVDLLDADSELLLDSDSVQLQVSG